MLLFFFLSDPHWATAEGQKSNSLLTPVLYSRETRILWSRNHKGVFVFFVTQKYFRQYKTLRYKNMHLFFDELILWGFLNTK